MTDKDKEIVQTLKNHIEAEDCVTCESFGKCNEFLLTKDTLDLINRQKAEIEKLKGSTIVSNIMESQRIKREAKAEAIKKFATKFLEKIHEHHYLLIDPYNSKDYGMFTTGIEQAVNETKKEMVGEDND